MADDGQILASYLMLAARGLMHSRRPSLNGILDVLNRMQLRGPGRDCEFAGHGANCAPAKRIGIDASRPADLSVIGGQLQHCFSRQYACQVEPNRNGIGPLSPNNAPGPRKDCCLAAILRSMEVARGLAALSMKDELKQ